MLVKENVAGPMRCDQTGTDAVITPRTPAVTVSWSWRIPSANGCSSGWLLALVIHFSRSRPRRWVCVRQGGHVGLDGGQLRAGGQDGGQLAACASGAVVRVAHDPAGHFAAPQWLGSRDRRGCGEAERGQLVTDDGAAAAIPAAADLPAQLGGVGAALVPPLVQVLCALIQQTWPLAAPVRDQQLARIHRAGEPADSVTGQVQFRGDHRQGLPFGEALMDGGVTLLGAFGDPPAARPGARPGHWPMPAAGPHSPATVILPGARPGRSHPASATPWAPRRPARTAHPGRRSTGLAREKSTHHAHAAVT